MTPQEFRDAQQYARTPFGKIAFYEKGEGDVALFVHGLPVSGYQWRGVIDDLAAERRCLAPDLMGLGNTDAPEGQDVSFGAQAQMLASFLDTLGVDTVDVVANDTGAGISQIFAATNPHRIRSLSILNCEAHDLWPNAVLEGFYKSTVAGEMASMMRDMLTDTKMAQQKLGPLIYENVSTLSRESIELYIAPLVESPKRVQQFKGLADWKTGQAQMMAVADRLEASRFPTQIIWGDADAIFDMDASLAWFRRHLGGLQQTTVLPGGMLFVAEERPRQVAASCRSSGD